MFDVNNLDVISCVDFATIGRIDHLQIDELDNGFMADDVATVATDNNKVFVIGYLISGNEVFEFVFDVALNHLVSLEVWDTVPESIIYQLDAAIRSTVTANNIQPVLELDKELMQLLNLK